MKDPLPEDGSAPAGSLPMFGGSTAPANMQEAMAERDRKISKFKLKKQLDDKIKVI
jgi:hypothetical protein